eukprot:scaffold36509_cov33-Tisochrysis_lutea.AAC.2
MTMAEGRRPMRAGECRAANRHVPGAARLSQPQPQPCAQAAGRASYCLPCPIANRPPRGPR